MKWLLVVIGTLAAIVAIVVAIGAALPQNHTATRSATLSVPPDTVWALITGVDAYPSWRRDVKSVERLTSASGSLAWREVNGGDKLSFEATAVEPPAHFVARITDRGIPFGGSWDYRIEPEGGGTRITITEHGEVYNPVFRFVSKYLMGHTATIDKYLTDLSARTGNRYVAG